MNICSVLKESHKNPCYCTEETVNKSWKNLGRVLPGIPENPCPESWMGGKRGATESYTSFRRMAKLGGGGGGGGGRSALEILMSFKLRPVEAGPRRRRRWRGRKILLVEHAVAPSIRAGGKRRTIVIIIGGGIIGKGRGWRRGWGRKRGRTDVICRLVRSSKIITEGFVLVIIVIFLLRLTVNNKLNQGLSCALFS